MSGGGGGEREKYLRPEKKYMDKVNVSVLVIINCCLVYYSIIVYFFFANINYLIYN